jgi:hypothetical protein
MRCWDDSVRDVHSYPEVLLYEAQTAFHIQFRTGDEEPAVAITIVPIHQYAIYALDV